MRIQWAGLLIAVVCVACARAPSPLPASGDAPSVGIATEAPPAANIGNGRPYTATDALAKLSEPYPAIPPTLRRLDIATAMSQAIWTYDGKPYRAWHIEASCPTIQCEVSVGGTPAFLPLGSKEDGYVFVVSLADRQLIPAEQGGQHGLTGYPPDLDAGLDGLGRSLVAPSELAGKVYRGANWWPPPRDGEFTLVYEDESGGNLEDHGRVWITLNMPDRRLISVVEGESPSG